ncbi:MAG: hypothetical protein ACYTG5_21500 [Planctomycetota bacterium]
MYLHFNLRKAKCKRVSDAGSESEFYWTWQVYCQEPDHTLLQQGFSTGCPIDDGYSYEPGFERELNDPRFTLELPEIEDAQTVEEANWKKIVFDLHCWESDHSTVEVKKAFSNDAAQILLRLYEEADAKKKQAIKGFEDWLNNSSEDLLTSIIEAAGTTATGGAVKFLKLGLKVIPLIKAGIEVVKSNSDDFVGRTRTELIYGKVEGKYLYRWIHNKGAEIWIREEQAPYFAQLEFLEANLDNEISCNAIFQTVHEATTDLVTDT